MTPPSEIDIEVWATKLAGVLGALVSMNFLQGTWPARFCMAISGAIVSFYATPHIADKVGLPEGLAGFLIGVFGMAIASRFWEWIQSAPISAIWQAILDWFRARAGAGKAEK